MSQPPNTRQEILKYWLKTRLRGIVSVQSCVITPASSLIVHTWTGVVINIYLLDEPVKPRALKKVLQEGTDTGIGSLFVLNADLLPQPETRYEVPEWLLALHAVTHDRVYATTIETAGPRLRQMHFEPVGSTGSFTGSYGPDVTFDQLRFLKVIVKHPAIKGEWQIGDFGFQPFWRDPFRPRHTEYRRPDNGNHRWQSWTQTSWDQPGREDIPQPNFPIRSRLDQCYALLEVAADATLEEVKVAYRRLAIKVHPDTSTMPPAEAEIKFRELTEAYEYIKSQRGW